MLDLVFSQDPKRGNVIEHTCAPRFTACWTSGDESLPPHMAEHWRDGGSGDRMDSLHVYNVQWHEAAPKGVAFDILMRLVFVALEAWIMERL
jgi:hypothetical protein